MGYKKVREGDHVIGSGYSPSTGKYIGGKHGDVVNTFSHCGNDVVEVQWKDGTSDSVRQDNVSGTGNCEGRRGCSS